MGECLGRFTAAALPFQPPPPPVLETNWRHGFSQGIEQGVDVGMQLGWSKGKGRGWDDGFAAGQAHAKGSSKGVDNAANGPAERQPNNTQAFRVPVFSASWRDPSYSFEA